MSKPFPGRWTFDHHPWLRDMQDSTASTNIGQKAAQMGYTECVLNKTFYEIDMNSVDCLYVLPTKSPDASDFSAARFDPAVELSTHLQNMFSDVKNVGHKRAGATNLYVRGSRSKAGLKSVPVGLLVLDEVEEMNQENIPLAMERMSGQLEKMVWAISTPFVEGEGINKLFQDSSQEHFFFKCPHCGKLTELIFPECFVYNAEVLRDSHYICKECNGILKQEEKIDWLKTGRWVPQYTNKESRGFYISQLYSPAITPYDIANSYRLSLTNQADEQELYNSKIGVPHEPDGARVTSKSLTECTKTYRKGIKPKPNDIVTLGVDVGKFLHYEVTRYRYLTNDTVDINMNTYAQVLDEGKFKDFSELDNLMRIYNIKACVIDANPERRMAFNFAMRFWGFVRLCFYGSSINGKQISMGSEEECSLTVDRTSWMDLSLSRFRNGTIELPMDVSLEYRQHIKAPVRILVKNDQGQTVARYNEGSKEDHAAHARTYSEIALQLAATLSQNEDYNG